MGPKEAAIRAEAIGWWHLCTLDACLFFFFSFFNCSSMNDCVIMCYFLHIASPGGPRHAKTCLRAYADSEGPDQTAHPRSMLRAFAVC